MTTSPKPAAFGRPDIQPAVHRHLGSELQGYFPLPDNDVLPERLAHLVTRFDAAVGATSADLGGAFRADIIRSMPALRVFAISLIRDPTRADDLVQETMVKAWSNRHRFTPGTNLSAWLFTILRNQFYSDMRKGKREVEDADGTHAATLTALPDQEGVASLRSLQEKLGLIPEAQRIALLLVGAEGYTYEEAAEKLHVKVGTVKSRVSRARSFLAELMGLDDNSPAPVMA
jgi:RNA polymerase sigma-70 factor (ECF subfamily)